MNEHLLHEAVNAAEYDSIASGVGVVELPERTHLELTGKDRASFLHGLCTHEIKKLLIGRGCETFFTNVQGKTIGHGYVFAEEQSHCIETAAGQGTFLVSHLDRYLFREDVQLIDRSAEWSELLLAGPQSSALLQRLVSSELPQTALHHSLMKLGDEKLRVRRSDFLRVPSFFLVAERAVVARVLARVREQGASDVSCDTVESVRIETGTPVFAQDITAENLPQEVGRDALAIHFNKGCYLGQETVARIDAMGHVNRTLVGVRFDHDAKPTVGTELFVGEKQVGWVTSVSYSPRLQARVALAYVRRGNNLPGAELVAAGGSGIVLGLPMVS